MKYRLKSDHGVECEAFEYPEGMWYVMAYVPADLTRPVLDSYWSDKSFKEEWEPVPESDEHVLRNSENGSELRGVKAEGDVARGTRPAGYTGTLPDGTRAEDVRAAWEGKPVEKPVERLIEEEVEKLAEYTLATRVTWERHDDICRQAAAEIRRLKVEKKLAKKDVLRWWQAASEMATQIVEARRERDAAKAEVAEWRAEVGRVADALGTPPASRPVPREVRLRWVEGDKLQIDLRDGDSKPLPFPAPIENISGVSAAPKSSK